VTGTPKDRQCVECERTFYGHQRRCPACCKKDRQCTDCGRAFRGSTLRCQPCFSTDRACTDCGRIFHGHGRRCNVCQRSDRNCTQCGNAFYGTGRRCKSCQNSKRECVGCGRTFTGTGKRCSACYAIERECVDCGRTFRSSAQRCASCWRSALPETARAALRRRGRNARRALQRAAEVAGPVPRAVYEAIAASGPCVYCDSEATAVDHVRPLARGGAEHEDNLVPACKPCNSSKRSRLLTEWDLDRVAHAVQRSPAVAAEMSRLLGARALVRELEIAL
jgi:5-methylcytosine-specific restriction endonuclease McrA